MVTSIAEALERTQLLGSIEPIMIEPVHFLDSNDGRRYINPITRSIPVGVDLTMFDVAFSQHDFIDSRRSIEVSGTRMGSI